MITCPICGKGLKDTRAKGGIAWHLRTSHGRTPEDVYVEFKCGGAKPTCRCGCGSVTKFNGWSKGYSEFVLGHNGRLDSLPEEEARAIREKRVAAQTGKVGWSRGLNSENSEVIRRRTEKIGEAWKRKVEKGYESPMKGQTKETNPSVLRVSVAIREAYRTGKRIAWAKGKTKETDEKVAKMAQEVRRTLQDAELSARLTALKRLSPEEILSRLASEAPNLELLTSVEDYARANRKNLQFKCKMCSLVTTRSLESALTGRCFSCTPTGSLGQIEVCDFVKASLPDVEVLYDVRSVVESNRRLQADVYVPSRKFAVEYNGLFFHSALHKGKDAHVNKTELFAAEGIQVLHVFEDEWRDKREIVESSILHKLKIPGKKISARKCAVVEVEPRDRREFFDRCHLDGDVRAEKCWGLVYQGEVVAALSVRQPFHKAVKNTYEIARFSCALRCHVNGGLGKLLRCAEEYTRSQGSSRILTYVDQRHGTGDGYLKVGFKLDHVTSPRFWWTNFNHRFDRFKYRANKKLGLTENQVAAEANVHKIWGCRNLVLIKDLS